MSRSPQASSHRAPRQFSLASPAVWGAVAALLAGCATTGTAPLASAPGANGAPNTAPNTAPSAAAPAATPGATAAARPGSAPAAAPAARPPAPGTPPAFAEVTKEAKRSDGHLPLWTKDEKTWLEIPAALLDKPMFFGNSLASGLGERGFWPGMMALCRFVWNATPLSDGRGGAERVSRQVLQA